MVFRGHRALVLQDEKVLETRHTTMCTVDTLKCMLENAKDDSRWITDINDKM